jgi:DNA processing protein
VNEPSHLTPTDPLYPSRLRALVDPPPRVTIAGAAVEADHVVAIIGRRDASPDAVAFAARLSRAVVEAGGVVASGGAKGIDAAAHRAALAKGGRTWAVAGTGCERLFPKEHASLYAEIARGPGAMIWPFEPSQGAWPPSVFLSRNRVLVALADAVVVVQASFPSGALNSARWATALGKPLWAVPVAPWMTGFEGSQTLLHQGARPLTSIESFVTTVFGLPGKRKHPRRDSELLPFPSRPESAPRAPSRPLTPDESALVAALGTEPAHLDELAERTHLGAQAIATALLTLALEDVVVEGPAGFFRRGSTVNT